MLIYAKNYLAHILILIFNPYIIIDGPLAQWLEQGTHNPWVASSSLAGPIPKDAESNALRFFIIKAIFSLNTSNLYCIISIVY